MRRLALLVMLAACGDKEQKSPPVSTEPALPTEAELRAQNTLAIVERGRKFEIRDAAGSVTLVLPAKPTVVGDVVTQGGQRAFLADATLRGALDIQFGVLTMQDRVVPDEVVKALDAAPFEMVKSVGGGDIQRNMKGTLAGQPAHVFELVTPTQRRVLGWYIPQPSRGRLIQLHCSGPEGDATRVDCDQIAATLTVAK